jgi:3-methyl-2-oxobutanoate hydroxymethyltransferase
MIYHTSLAARGVRRALLIADMPFGSYQAGSLQAVLNAAKLLKRGGASAVKLEGGERMAEQIAACVRAEIPVMGHVGLTPQSVHRLGGFKVQRDAEAILADARAVEQAGAFSLVVECVPSDLAAKVTAAVAIPTIGIGAGPHCDGQVLVFHDLLGLYDGLRPKFVKRYAELGEAAREAIRGYCQEVRGGKFPGPEHESK